MNHPDMTLEDRAEAILRDGKVPDASNLASEHGTSLWAAERAIERAYDRLDRPAQAYKPAKRSGPMNQRAVKAAGREI